MVRQAQGLNPDIRRRNRAKNFFNKNSHSGKRVLQIHVK